MILANNCIVLSSWKALSNTFAIGKIPLGGQCAVNRLELIPRSPAQTPGLSRTTQVSAQGEWEEEGHMRHPSHICFSVLFILALGNKPTELLVADTNNL